MTTKNKIDHVKKFHKDQIREFSQNTDGIDMYSYYFLGGDKYRRARCYGDLFGYIFHESVESYSGAVYPLKFNRRLKYFNYDSLFKDLNKIYGHYFRISRYYSGYRYTRLIHINPIKKLPCKALHWAGLYTIYLLLRKINVHYYDYWADFFEDNPKQTAIKTWKDVVSISEIGFGDDGYYLHDELFKKCWSSNKSGANTWINNYFKMLNDIYGKGMIGDNTLLNMGPATYNTSAINGLLRFWESV